jgi:hypothetical protein
VTAEQQQDGAAERLRTVLALRAEHGVHDFTFDDDVAAVLDERAVLAARVAKLEGEAVDLREIRDSRVREVRAAHAAGWLDHAEFVAERNRTGFTARETAGQAYTTARIADWHEHAAALAGDETDGSGT